MQDCLVEPDERVQRLLAAASAYAERVSPAYDEVVEQVAARAAAAGNLDKLDLAALTAWKRLRADTPWMAQRMGTADTEVRLHTARAVAAAQDQTTSVPEAAAAARSALIPLPGFSHGDALAAAVCFAAAPYRLAVYDTRAHRGRVSSASHSMTDLAATAGTWGSWSNAERSSPATATPGPHGRSTSRCISSASRPVYQRYRANRFQHQRRSRGRSRETLMAFSWRSHQAACRCSWNAALQSHAGQRSGLSPLERSEVCTKVATTGPRRSRTRSPGRRRWHATAAFPTTTAPERDVAAGHALAQHPHRRIAHPDTGRDHSPAQSNSAHDVTGGLSSQSNTTRYQFCRGFSCSGCEDSSPRG